MKTGFTNLSLSTVRRALGLSQTLIRDVDGTIFYWNEGAEAMYGWTAEEAVGRRLHELLRTEFPKPLSDIQQELLRAGRWQGQLKHTRKDGSCLYVASHWVLQRSDDDEPTLVIETNNDISDQKRIEQDLEISREALRRSNEDLQQFALAASHDLREPLRSIASFSELIAKRLRGKDPEADEYIEYVRRASARMERLIDQLLRFAKVGDEQQYRTEAADTSEIVQDVLAGLRTAIEESGAIITVEPLPTVRGNAALLTLVFQNLIGNALKYRSDEIPRVHIAATHTHESCWEFCVRDNGIGFDQNYAHRLFQLFARLHSRQEYSGSGIGLALVRRIVERHRGRVWAESKTGQGSTFYFTIPADLPTEPAIGHRTL